MAKRYSEPHQPRPLPGLLDHERKALERWRRGYERGAKDAPPPPWVHTDEADEADALASFVALAPARRSRSGEAEWWLVRGVLRRSAEGPPLLTRVSVEHWKDPEAEVTGIAMRDLNFGAIRESACASLAFQPVIFKIGEKVAQQGGYNVFRLAGWNEQWAQAAAAEAERPLRRGRKGYPKEHYHRIALRYLDLIGSGRRDVLKALAAEEEKRLGRAVPRETVRDWVRKATELGFLAPGKQGRASARPGPNLKPKEKDG
jgi:hypothetical protein